MACCEQRPCMDPTPRSRGLPVNKARAAGFMFPRCPVVASRGRNKPDPARGQTPTPERHIGTLAPSQKPYPGSWQGPARAGIFGAAIIYSPFEEVGYSEWLHTSARAIAQQGSARGSAVRVSGYPDICILAGCDGEHQQPEPPEATGEAAGQRRRS